MCLEGLLPHHPPPDGPPQLVVAPLPGDTELVPVALILLVQRNWVRGGGSLANRGAGADPDEAGRWLLDQRGGQGERLGGLRAGRREVDVDVERGGLALVAGQHAGPEVRLILVSSIITRGRFGEFFKLFLF